MQAKNIVYACIVIATWGINPLLTHSGSQLIDVKTYTVMTSFFFVAATIILSSISKPGLWVLMSTDMSFKLFVISFTDGVLCLAVLFYIYNMLLTNSESIGIIVSITWCAAPIVTTILSYLILGMKITSLQCVGMGVAVVGIFVMSWF